MCAAGHDAIHCQLLPSGARSTDEEIATIADAEGRVVVTKDRDFRDSHLLRGGPKHLLLIVAGNMSNQELLGIIAANLQAIVALFDESNFVELGPRSLIAHENRPE